MKNIPEIKINTLTYFFVFLFLFSGYKNILFVIALILFVHECGHIFFCILFKIKVNSIEVLPFGGLIKIKKLINYDPVKDLLIASGGILFQILFGIINQKYIHSDLISKYNYLILITNILPAIPLDGSKIIMIIISNYVSYYKTIRIVNFISFLTIVSIFIFESCIFNSINYAFICFLFYYLFLKIKYMNYEYNKFLFERYLYDLRFKKSKFYPKFSLKYLKKNVYGYFYVNSWQNEKYFLRKKFDINTYFW